LSKTPSLLLLLIFALSACTTAHVSPSAGAESDFRAFLTQWEEGQSRFINGDPTLWKQNASHQNDVTLLGGFGGHGEKGWDAVGARYDWASSQYKAGAILKVEYIHIGVSGDLAYTVSVERQTGARVGDQPATQRALRATQIFRKEAGAWKLIHRHADRLIEKEAP
jgi:ketosteroid isomerase-like protein